MPVHIPSLDRFHELGMLVVDIFALSKMFRGTTLRPICCTDILLCSNWLARSISNSFRSFFNKVTTVQHPTKTMRQPLLHSMKLFSAIH